MEKFKFEIESNFCIEDIKNIPELFRMFADTAVLEGSNKKQKRYNIKIEEL